MEKTSLTQVRRRDRNVADDSWIRERLTKSPTGVVAVSNNGQPYIHANLFIYDEKQNVIYFHTSSMGHLRQNVENSPKASFIIFEMGRLIAGPRALDFSVEYASVVVFGTVVIVREQAEIMDVLQRYFTKYASHIPSENIEPFTWEDAKKTTVYKLHIAEWSGKEHRESDDHPNAFFYKCR